jgi:Gpi18-like mannosyltransferase
VVGSPVLAGVLISLVAFTTGLALVHRIATEEISARVANTTVLLLAFAPFSFVFSAVYTES